MPTAVRLERDPQSAATLAHAREVIDAEGEAIAGLVAELDDRFVAAVECILTCRGRVVVTGMGKSGLVGRKISATLASTGTPSTFLHAADAAHGDLGQLTGDDVVLALSNSGESQEVVRIVRPVKGLGAYLIAITGDPASRLASHADLVIPIGDIAEACPMGLVPTASTTAMMVIGDALAICLFKRRGFGREEYARFHPGGTLGHKLIQVREVMRRDNENPLVAADATVRAAIGAMTDTEGRPGAASIVDGDGRLVGFLTDGDLRRMLMRDELSLEARVGDVMHPDPWTVAPQQLIVEAARVMREHKIDQVPVVDADGRPIGLLDVQDLLATNVV